MAIGFIYKLSDINNTKCYIGSTTQKINTRFSKHKNLFKRYLDDKMHYLTCFELFMLYGKDNLKIELLEEFEYEIKKELNIREGFFIKNTVCVNKLIAGGKKNN